MTQRAGVVVVFMYGVGQGAIQDVYFPRKYAELRESIRTPLYRSDSPRLMR